MSNNDKDVMKPAYDLYDVLRRASALIKAVVSAEAFNTDTEGRFSDVLALSELCRLELDKARKLHEACETSLNNLSRRLLHPQEGDRLPGELLDALLELAASPNKDEAWGREASHYGSALAGYAVHHDDYKQSVESLAKMGQECGLDLRVSWNNASHQGVIYYGVNKRQAKDSVAV
jgi:hypothetical protein